DRRVKEPQARACRARRLRARTAARRPSVAQHGARHSGAASGLREHGRLQGFLRRVGQEYRGVALGQAHKRAQTRGVERELRDEVRRTRLGSALVLAVCGTVLAAAASSQTYPVRAIRIIMPYSAGGAGDVQGRILAQRLSESLGQQVVIDNRPGAGSTIGAELAAKSSPDGYTLFWIANTHFVAAAMQKKLAYDPLNDYTPVTQVTSAPNVLVIHPSLPPRTVKELIVLARARPGQLDYASSGNGSTQHLTGALFCKMAGIRMTHIPYRGSGPATSDLLGGQVM